MTHTARASTLALRWKTIFEANLKGNEDFNQPPILDVFYGDQNKIPRTPAICVEPGEKARSWPPLPTLRSENDLEVHFLVYYAAVTGSEELKFTADLLGEKLEEYIHANHLTLADADGNPLVIHGNVVNVTPRYVRRNGNNTLFHASHLTWRAITKTQLAVAG